MARASFTVAAFAVAALTTACAPAYRAPMLDEPHAVLVLRQTEAIAPTSIGLTTSIGETQDVSQFNYPLFLRLNLWGRDPDKEFRIRADRPVYLEIVATLTGGTCANYVTFTPQVGQTYVLDQPVEGASCRVRIVDRSTNRIAKGARYFRPVGVAGTPDNPVPTYEGPLED